RRLEGAAKHVSRAPCGGIVAARVAKLSDEPRLEPGALGTGERDRVRGVAEHLTALEAGDVVKEPTTRRHGAQHPSLHFDEPRGVLVAPDRSDGSGGLEKRPGSPRQI